MSKWIAFSAALLGWQLLACDCSLAQGIQTIALTGDPVPGSETGETLGAFRLPAFNNHGQVAFVSSLAGTSGQGLFFGDGNGLQSIAVTGEQAPDTPQGTRFHRFDPALVSILGIAPQLNDDGTVAFMASLRGDRGVPVNADNGLGLWTWNAGSSQMLLRTGDPVPNGLDGEVFGVNFILANQNSAGDVSFYGYSLFDIVDRHQGFWRTDSGSPRKVAVWSTSAPEGIPGYPGYRFSPPLNDISAVHLDDIGRLNFEAYYQSPAGSASGIWREINGQYELLVHSGQAAPADAEDVNFAAILSAEFNGIGQSVFRAQLAGAEVTDANNSGIWFFNGTSLEKIARSGDAVPGLSGDWMFGQLVPYELSNSGGAVLTAQLLAGSSESAGTSLWKYAAGNLELIARSGDAAPGTEPGVTFSALYFDPEINARNQAALWGQVSGDGIDTTNDHGLWAQDANGELQLIVREGDQIEVQPGEFRTVSALRHDVFRQNHSQTSYLNDRGQVVFVADFTDGSQGMFISNLVAVPEPSALALALVGLPAACGPRRMRRN